MNLSALEDRLRVSEGWSEHAYIDTTGNVTIGFGHNLGKLLLPDGVKHSDVQLIPVNGISRAIGDVLLRSDVTSAVNQVKARAWSSKLDDIRLEVLSELVFNIGPKVLDYPVFSEQLAHGQWKAAAQNMRGWLWVKQVGKRAEPLCRMLETGERV